MQQKFKEIWLSLSAAERDIAIVWSMVYEAKTVLDFARLLNNISLLPPAKASRFTHAFTQEVTEKLHDLGLVKRHPEQGWIISTTHSEALMRMASMRPDFTFLLNDVRRELPYKPYYQPHAAEPLMREIRMAFYQQNESLFDRMQKEAANFFPAKASEGYFYNPLFEEFDARWVETLPLNWQMIAIRAAYNKALENWESLDGLLSFLESHHAIREPDYKQHREWLSEIYMLKGEWSRLLLWADLESTPWRRQALQLIYRVVKDEDEKVEILMQGLLPAYQQEKKNSYPADLSGYFYYLSLLRNGGVQHIDKIGLQLSQTDILDRPHLSGVYFVMQALEAFLRNEADVKEMAESGILGAPQNGFSVVFEAFYNLWTGQAADSKFLKRIDRLRDRAQLAGYRWVEMELTKVLSIAHHYEEFKSAYSQRAQDLEQALQISSLVNAMPRIEEWERALEVLSSLGLENRSKEKKRPKTSRLIWVIDVAKREIEAREQSLGKSGTWSKGRKVALRRIKEGEFQHLQPQDLAVAKTIEEETVRSYPQGTFFIRYEEAILALVNHPLVFLAQNINVNVELVKRSPQLLIEENEGDLALRFAQNFSAPGVQLIKETPTRYQVIEVTENHARILQQIGSGLVIPKRARHRLLEVSRHLGHIVEIQSTLNGQVDDIDKMEASEKIYVHLLPIAETFKLEFFVRPVATDAQYYKPGEGRKKVFTEVNGFQQIASRSLEKEVEAADQVVAACPSLQRIVYRDYEWQIDEVDDCLQILLELQPLRSSEQIVLEHPRGEKLRLVGSADFADLSLKLKGSGGWFDVEGTLRIDEQQVLSFRALLEHMEASPNSPFVQLSDGQFIALTEQLRRKLREMEGLVEERPNGDLRLHPLAAGVLDDFTDYLGEFEADMAWAETLKRLDNFQAINLRVPASFQAELRPYQLDGFRWMSRLANWGVGACLADDMGLGKTIQALAILAARAEHGPSLIIAPASVTRNWAREAEKFAPSLRPVLLGDGDRAEIIEQVGPHDMLIVSYGLLPFEGEILARKQFATIVLDEAQAIKNRGTKRSQVVMNLQADFKLVTTGTPIENHLGELWNLFQFLNPGLLGTYQRFTDKFIVPITKNNDGERRQQLRRIIQPFILRRRKSEVLTELPPKTEVNLSVELSAAERAFYEALRQSAIDNIEGAEGPNRRFHVLAELIKLRQAACHPQIIDPSLNIGSSKLSLVAETVEELREGGHKMLIFSQFVKHLSIVRAWLDEAGIPYQYLDGSTTGKQRDMAVQAFQAGEGDVFLISLRAGGTGLTLTAADYVLHLDPWWNPAVEDQASDRAHRIGQDRPVTVYRFIAENTIEEKIVKLHADKRDLADSLLAGTAQSAQLDTEELLNLIRYT